MNLNEFIEELKKLNIELDQDKFNKLEIYYNLLIEYNKVMNLTGITEKDQVYLKHFYDSLTICKVIDLNKNYTLCDMGTGAGFPGIVLKIIFPNLKITLVDSLNKRINFLNIVIEKLNLKDIETVSSRIEEYGKTNREMFDIVTARAVASLNILLEYAFPILKKDGYFIPMKAVIEENYKNALNILKGKVIKEEKFILPFEESHRTILLIQKIEKTNIKYPRNYSKIKKNPL